MPRPDAPSQQETLPPQGDGIDNMRAIGWILASVVGASAMNVAVREMSMTMDTRVIVILRASIIAVGLAFLLLALPRARGKISFSRPWLHIQRGALIAIATHLGFYTVATIPLATATVLFFMAPIFATLLAILLHGEVVGIRRWSAIAAGFLGVLIIMRPGATPLHPGMLTALASSAFFALALNQSRALSRADGALSAYLSSVVITVLISIPLAYDQLSLPVTGALWAVLAVVVLGGALRGFADIEAYRFGEAAVLAPMTYLRLPLIGAAGYVLYDEIPDGATILGAAIIISATFYIAQRERRKRGNR